MRRGKHRPNDQRLRGGRPGNPDRFPVQSERGQRGLSEEVIDP